MGEQAPGVRVYLIRLALGDGVKNPMRIKDFVALVKERTGVSYDPSAISRTENGERDLALDDVPPIAAVDPLKRGRTWLAWGDANEDAALRPNRERVSDGELAAWEASPAEDAPAPDRAAAGGRRRPKPPPHAK